MVTQLGTFQYNCLPFGPKNAPAHFQKAMRATLGELEGVIAMVYIDDIIIYSNNFEDHLKHIKMVFDKLKAKNLIVSEEKAHFCLKQVKILGKIVTGEGIATDPTLIKDMLDFPELQNQKQTLSFLGLTTY